jgi:ABC-2 type transport system ATP-binding protein
MLPLLRIRNLFKTYKTDKGTIEALKNVSFDIHQGEIFGLLGVNGAGKTTLSSIIATVHPATKGEVLYKESSIYENINRYRQHIGFCPQKPNFESTLTVEENLIFAGRYYGLSSEEIKVNAQFFMEKFELTRYAQHKVDVLSGGYKQRLLIARALMHKPTLVLLDEPTVALDPHIRRQLWDLIKSLKETGVTVILTTHYLDEAEYLADRVCILDKGNVVLIDTPERLKTHYNKANLEEVFLELMKTEETQ